MVDVEVVRAVRRRDAGLLAAAERVVAQVSRVGVSEDIRARAAGLEPAELRSLDAIHLATAIELRDKIERFATYDIRLADAARRAGFSVLAPR